MILPLTRVQSIIAYSSLAIILAWMAFGLFAIWTIVTHP
jgi:hypothetical protein